MRGSVLAPTPLPPHSENETMRRGRRPAQRMAAKRQVKVSRGTKTRKNEQAYSQGGGPEAQHVDQHAHEEQRGRHFTPRTIYTDSTGALSLPHLESDPLAENNQSTHKYMQTHSCLYGKNELSPKMRPPRSSDDSVAPCSSYRGRQTAHSATL